MRKERWIPVGACQDLAHGTVTTFKHDGHQLAIGRTQDGRFFAVDNRCPHEGYPLAQGDLKGCVLTCAWHNWKFDVHDGGRCVLGGESVRSYPIRTRGSEIEIDLAEPDPETRIPELMRSLDEALFHQDLGRALREALRLLGAGVAPVQILADVARYDARRGEYGLNHVLALAADMTEMLPRFPGMDAIYPIAPVLDLCAESDRRLPERPRPAPISGATGEELRRLAQAEETVRAEGLLAGALRDGVARATVESWLYTILSDHFVDFGHGLIYLVKAQDLLGKVAPAYAVEIYPSLLFGVLAGTREDTLPYMRSYFRHLADVEVDLGAVYAASTQGGGSLDSARLRDAVLDGTASEAFGAVWGALSGGVRPEEVARALVGAAAHRLYRFDLDVDRDGDVQDGWLYATHRFTFASAVRQAVTRFASPDALRFLIQAVAFIHSGRGLDAPPERRTPIEVETATVEAILEAILRRDATRAVARTLGYLRSGARMAPLRSALEDHCLRDPHVRPIFVCHALKTTLAAFAEVDAQTVDREWPLLATVRYLASPVVERQLFAAARAQLRWVVEGKRPTKLTQ